MERAPLLWNMRNFYDLYKLDLKHWKTINDTIPICI